MAAPTEQHLSGDELLNAVTELMVASHEHYHGRAPATARSMLMDDDLLACILGGVYTDVEKTLIEMQRQPDVIETRSAFRQAMGSRVIRDIERISGRRVDQYISQNHVGPDLEIALFFFAPSRL